MIAEALNNLASAFVHVLPANKSDCMCYSVAITICPYSFSNAERSANAP